MAVGFYLAIIESASYLITQNATCDYHFMFEDDARPFPGTTWPVQEANDLDARLNYLEDVGGSVLLLGGHGVQNFSREEAMMAAARPHGGIVGAVHANGAYAVIVKYSALEYAQ